ncbi:MAG: Fic family protein [Nanoarchaeota archaeon]
MLPILPIPKFSLVFQLLWDSRKQKTICFRNLKKSTFFSKEQLEEIEAVHLHFKEKFLKLDDLTRKEFFEVFLIKFAVSSTSIEGNTITLEQAGKLLIENITPKNKTLREIYDLKNTQQVFFKLLDEMPDISLKMIEDVHDGLLVNIDLRTGYRTDDLRILGQPFKPTPGKYVKSDMKMLLEWYEKNKNKMHPLALAILFHHKFESIHPFYDGNGLTGRIIMNHLLIQLCCPPLIVPIVLRREYLDVISEADGALKKDLLSTDMNHYQDLFSFMVNQYVLTYWNNFLI